MKPGWDTHNSAYERTEDNTMDLSFLTPEIFNMLVVLNLVVGGALAVWRFRRDVFAPPFSQTAHTRLLRRAEDSAHLEETRPHAAQSMPEDAAQPRSLSDN